MGYDNKPITVKPPLNMSGHPEVNLTLPDFEAVIYQKGYDVWLDTAIKCPCSSKSGGSPQSSCKNCGGSGWFYVNRTKTKAVLQSMNLSTEYKEWSEELLGTVRITVRAEDRLSFMDRITVLDSETDFNQVIFLQKQPDNTNEYYGRLRYAPIDTYSVFLYTSASTKPELLEEGVDFEWDGVLFKSLSFSQKTLDHPTISVRYRHRVEYTVLDLQREIMVSESKDGDCSGTKKRQFPILAVGRRSHYILESEKIKGDHLFDNSFSK